MSEGAKTRETRARWTVATLIAVVVACAAACAGPPSSGPISMSTLNHDTNQISITSKLPYGGEGPKEIVKGFLAATTGDDHDPTFAIAKLYMTPDVAAQWDADKELSGGAAVIYDKTPSVSEPVPTPTPEADQPTTSPSVTTTTDGQVEETTTVTVTGMEMASRNVLGYYKVASSTPSDTTVTLKLAKTKNGWRIASKPQHRVLGIDDFRRAYPTPSPVFQPAELSQTTVRSVDQVYLTPSNTLATYRALVQALLGGRGNDPSAPVSSVTTDPSSSSTVTIELDKPLKGDPKALELAIQDTFQAAVATSQLGVGSAEFSSFKLVYRNYLGQTLPLHSSADITFPSVYFTVDGGVYRGDVPDEGSASPPAATILSGGANRKLGKIAVKQEAPGADDTLKTDSSTRFPTVAAVNLQPGPGYGDVEVTGNVHPGKAPGQPTSWYHTDHPDDITDLAWDPVDGGLWIVDGGDLWKVPPPAANGQPTPGTKVDRIPGYDQYQRFRLSPDGRNAVVVTGAGVDTASSNDRTQALMVAIDRADPDTTQLLKLKFPLVVMTGPSTQDQTPLTHIADVAWAGRTIVFLAKASGQATAPPKLYKVYEDGSQDLRLLDSGEEAEAQATRIAASPADPGSPLLRLFSNGSQADAKSGIYWKGRTFDLFQSGDDPVLATVMVNAAP
jgi:hypothetical protein